MHIYTRKTKHVIPNNDSSDSDYDSDDDGYEVFDGIFMIYDNLDELNRCNIENNAISATGFAEAIKNFVC